VLNLDIDEDVQSTTRTGIIHLQKMPDLEFIEFIQHVKTALSGKLQNLSVSLKVDGAGARFGLDDSGRPFFEGSRTGPIFHPRAFSAHAASKGSAPDVMLRAHHYDDIFEIVVNSKFIRTLPNNTKVICELFYNPMGEITDTGIKFVSVSYDSSKLGRIMTIVPFQVVDATTGQSHPRAKEIINNLYQQSNDEIKFIDVNLATTGAIDISGLIDPILSLDAAAITTLQSRKSADSTAKADIRVIIQRVKDSLAHYILTHPGILDKFKLGPEIEGLVLNIDGRLIKVTTPEFKASKVKPQTAKPQPPSKPMMEFITQIHKVTKIPHPEDFIFQGSKDAMRAVQIIKESIINPKTVSIKWDGSPAIVFGRRSVDGKFTMNYKSYITEPGGQVTTAQELQEFYRKRDGNPVVANKLARIFNAISTVVPENFKGYVLADLLWDNPLGNKLQFRPNPHGVLYTLDPHSPAGKHAIGRPVGLVVYMYAASLADSSIASKSKNPFVDETHLYDYAGLHNKSKHVCVFPSTAGLSFRLAEPVQAMRAAVSAINRHGSSADELLSRITNGSAQCIQTWYNKKITNQMSENQTLLSYIGPKLDSHQIATVSNSTEGLMGIDSIWHSIYALKQAIVKQLDSQVIGIGQSVGGQPVGEGFVVNTDSGLIKLVNRQVFSTANFAGRI
jgi:hypothetical protein